MKKILIACISIAALGFVSCASTKNLEVPVEASAAEIIQMAQTETDKGNYDLAKKYYVTLLQRYGMNNTTYVEGRFEIAHLLVKQKKYAEALPMLDEIISMYSSSDARSLPQAYYKLAILDKAKIPDNVIHAAASGN